MTTFSVWRAAVAAVAFSVLFGVMGGNALAAHPRHSTGEILWTRTEEFLARELVTALQNRSIQLRETGKPFSQPARHHRFERFYWGGCGWGRSLVVEPRVSKLPSNPILVLGDSYLKCQMIRAALLEPMVSVASYPPGYFGGYVYEGLFVTDWIEFSDEALLQQLFTLLVEVPDGPDEEMEFVEWNDHAVRLAELRQGSGFVPELVFEFVGDAPLSFEINLTNGRGLIQAGDKWSFYSIDRLSAAELRGLLATRPKKPGG